MKDIFTRAWKSSSKSMRVFLFLLCLTCIMSIIGVIYYLIESKNERHYQNKWRSEMKIGDSVWVNPNDESHWVRGVIDSISQDNVRVLILSKKTNLQKKRI